MIHITYSIRGLSAGIFFFFFFFFEHLIYTYLFSKACVRVDEDILSESFFSIKKERKKDIVVCQGVSSHSLTHLLTHQILFILLF